MTIYRDTNSSVTFTHPYPGPLVATVYRNSTLILTSSALNPVDGVYTLDLTYNETQYDGPLDITWSDAVAPTTFFRTTTEEVVTPLVTIDKLRTLFTDANWGDGDLIDLESSVRTFIQTYTGQTYGYEVATFNVVGTGSKNIILPKHLLSLTSVSGGPAGFFWVANDGWSLNAESVNMLTIKEAPPEEYMDNTLVMTKGVIVVPDSYWRKFRVGTTYAITGEWGYYSVPDDIREAALILANDFACGDSLYRDRFVSTIDTGTGSISYNSGAYQGTGNVKADRLLSDYIRSDKMVII